MTEQTTTVQSRIVSGSLVLLSGSGLTTAINLVYNIVVARFLGPKGFGQATVVYTILTLISAVTLSFQIVSAKLVAQQTSPEGKAAVYRGLHRSAWGCGIAVALLLLAFRGAITVYLDLPSPALVALVALGASFYVPLGSRRGFILGSFGFRRVATNLVIEGALRLGGSFVLIILGQGVEGVVAANAAAIAIAYFAAAPPRAALHPSPFRFSYVAREALQAMIFFSGQVLINNCDIVLVKHFFSGQEAGLYAAVAMVGRVVFAFSSAVVNAMFPVVAGTREEKGRALSVVATSLLLVLGIGVIMAIGLAITPPGIWTALFGTGFTASGKYSMTYLLALYAITAIVYSLSVVIISFEMSYKLANTSLLQLAFSGLLIAGLLRFHSSLREVIIVQLVLMVALLVFVAIPFLLDSLGKQRVSKEPRDSRPVRLIQRVSENEVISEFLRSDFSSPAFRRYQEFEHVVRKPNLNDPGENAKRRALLSLRHLALWREIPTKTEWYEVEIDEFDLRQIQVFPRAQWRKLGRGNFRITQVVEALRRSQTIGETPFLAKLSSMGDQLHQDIPGFSAVILIGVSESGPLTVLDGNHRLAAALLAEPGSFKKLRFLCGLSPNMSKCCWYNTNLNTLFRYGINHVVHVFRFRGSEISQMSQKL